MRLEEAARKLKRFRRPKHNTWVILYTPPSRELMSMFSWEESKEPKPMSLEDITADDWYGDPVKKELTWEEIEKAFSISGGTWEYHLSVAKIRLGF